MTIFSSLNVGVMGLSVNATRLATISDNIANSATYGYKRSEVEFSSMVLRTRENAYSAGGVRVQTFKDVEGQGALISTGNSTDIAITGRGMLPTTDYNSVYGNDGTKSLLLTSTGSFTADENGYLRTSGGLYLTGWPANSSGEIDTVARDSATGLEPINVNVAALQASPTDKVNLGLNLPADSTMAGAVGDVYDLPVEYFDNLGRSQTLTFQFAPSIPATGSSNQWTVEVFDSASAPDPAVAISTFDIIFDSSASNGGRITEVIDAGGAAGDAQFADYDPVEGLVSFNTQSGSIQAFIGQPDSGNGISQLSSNFSPYNVTKNGFPIGDLSTMEINGQGMLQAVYDNGFRRTIYQIPVADVPNMNGLTPQDNQAFTVSQNSGEFYLWDAGSGPVGEAVGYALVESTTDVAGELTDLIETQRAYSSNATVIRTVDEMLQETTNIKR